MAAFLASIDANAPPAAAASFACACGAWCVASVPSAIVPGVGSEGASLAGLTGAIMRSRRVLASRARWLSSAECPPPSLHGPAPAS
eukprot:CAMPEP_0119074034 /NCGR_PEP_ID=MMETSP1178-20130426/70943_1 /TAXON_ID=33656 /ORGANISM="unid sp, Strain CCMP2000" /LENGTH=85 /DNA_ID=CAMNT_0007056167 /DNA_START=98 /DNA_END=352 /DNA_ORIENTATION=+